MTALEHAVDVRRRQESDVDVVIDALDDLLAEHRDGVYVDTRRLGFHEFVDMVDRHLTTYYPEDVFTGYSSDPGVVFVARVRGAVQGFRAVTRG